MEPINWSAVQGFGVRCRTWRPPDPVWAGQETLRQVRAALHTIDPKLDVWWEPGWRSDTANPGRWAFVYWMARAGNWSVAFYWEDAAGGFRQLSFDCIEQIRRQLWEYDSERAGMDPKEMNRTAENQKEERKQKRLIEVRTNLLEHGRRMAQKIHGEYRMSRARRLIDTNHQKWAEGEGLK